MRRQVPRSASAVPLGVAIASPQPTDIRIAEIVHGYEDYVYRAPYKFGGRIVDRVTLLNVHCRVTTRNGETAWGFASMTLGNVWAFPSSTMSYDTTLDAMKALASRIARLTGDCPEIGHRVTVVAVNVLTTKAKEKSRGTRRGRILGSTSPWRKAIVTLAPGQKIQFFEGV